MPLLLAPLLAIIVAVAAAAAVAGRTVAVSQAGRAFSAATLALQRGDIVHFTNDDHFDHQLYIDAPGFKVETAEQAPGTAQDIQFTKAGLFDVQCQIHPRMHLAVTVQ